MMDRCGMMVAMSDDLMQTPAGGDQPAGRHLVQFYEADPASLVANVVSYFEAGLAEGDAVALIATAEHTDAFLRALSHQGEAAGDARSRPLMCLDADATLARFMIDGQPDWRRFEQTVGGIIRTLRRSARSGRLHAYGEMVGLLWQRGQTAAAVSLERFWNVLLAEYDFTLFCGYPINVFDGAFRPGDVDEVLCTHTAVLTGGAASTMEAAVERAMHDVLGTRAAVARAAVGTQEHSAWPALPHAERQLLWLRENLPEFADVVAARAQQHYAALRTTAA
jgi:MEDS: MEthanogen/methylotroph, DcmR Sensory domain